MQKSVEMIQFSQAQTAYRWAVAYFKCIPVLAVI
jgi:hypothetical protein